MPQFKTGDMFEHAIGNILVTTNASVRKDGTLVMGRGAALQAAKLYPGIDYKLGQRVKQFGYRMLYGTLWDRHWPIGAFQVKRRWMDKADIEIIKESVKQLRQIAIYYKDVVWNVNYPGIGNGGLSKDVVAPLLAGLPENVVIWEM